MTWQPGLNDFITQRCPLESRRCNSAGRTDFYPLSTRRWAGWGLEGYKYKTTQLQRQDGHCKKKCCSAPPQPPSPTSNVSAGWVSDAGLSNSFLWNIITTVTTATRKPKDLPLLLMNLLGVLKPVQTELWLCFVKCFCYLNQIPCFLESTFIFFHTRDCTARSHSICLGWDEPYPKKANTFSLH